jgi:hypothetical protein
MLRRAVAGLILAMSFILAVGLAPVKADVLPPKPQPMPSAPDGPAKATIRGIGVEQSFTYWKGRRWMTVVDSCAPSLAVCQAGDLSGCFVVGFNNQSVPAGDIAALLALEKSAGDIPIMLMMEKCRVDHVELAR